MLLWWSFGGVMVVTILNTILNITILNITILNNSDCILHD